MPLSGTSFSTGLRSLAHLNHSSGLQGLHTVQLQHSVLRELAVNYSSGYIALEEGFLLLHKEKWCWAGFEGLQGMCAYQRILENTTELSATFCHTAPEVSRALLAMFLGQPEDSQSDTATLTTELQSTCWTGCVRIWESFYVIVRGHALAPLPEHKGVMTRMVCPAEPFPDLAQEYETYLFYSSRAKLQSVWFRIEIILQEFVGNQSGEVLNRLKQWYPETNPEALKTVLRNWIVQTLNNEALEMFNQQG